MGLALIERSNTSIKLKTDSGKVLCFTIMQIFPFTSEAKRMGIILRVSICFLTGALFWKQFSLKESILNGKIVIGVLSGERYLINLFLFVRIPLEGRLLYLAHGRSLIQFQPFACSLR